ncbi:hypothetical protein [Burkholderia paludis]|nr:hypothetical protein [Burkholderia paludis]
MNDAEGDAGSISRYQWIIRPTCPDGLPFVGNPVTLARVGEACAGG